DLYKRATASPSATETNITARLTAGARWDVKDVDTSPDGTRVVFAMRGPLAVNQDPSKPPSWRIYEYVIASDTLRTVIDPATDPTVNDVSPHYLPDGRIVFQSNTQPLLANAGLPGPAQTPATPNDVRTIPGPSPGGRFNSAYPLHDGTGRILVSWTQCRLLDTTQTPPAIVPCTPTALAAPNPQAAPPLYSVWMFDPKQNTLMPIMQPVEGVMVTDVAVAQPRALPNIILDKVAGVDFDSAFVTAGVGVLDIKSVYDFDGMDTAMPNIQTVADPSKTPPSGRQYRFIRLEKAVSIPDKDLVNLAAAA